MIVTDPGRTRRWGHIFRGDGRSLVLAMDHGATFGVGPPFDPEVLEPMIRSGVDAVLTTPAVAAACAPALASVGLLLRVDGGRTGLCENSGDDRSTLTTSVEAAARAGADAVTVMGYPGLADESNSLQRLGEVADRARGLGLLVMAEMVPYGFGASDRWSADVVARSARIGAELGADIIKTVVPKDGDIAHVCQSCPVPVMMLGGAAPLGDDGVAGLAEAARAAGAAGLAVGRNLWNAADPPSLIELVSTILHPE